MLTWWLCWLVTLWWCPRKPVLCDINPGWSVDTMVSPVPTEIRIRYYPARINREIVLRDAQTIRYRWGVCLGDFVGTHLAAMCRNTRRSALAGMARRYTLESAWYVIFHSLTAVCRKNAAITRSDAVIALASSIGQPRDPGWLHEIACIWQEVATVATQDTATVTLKFIATIIDGIITIACCNGYRLRYSCAPWNNAIFDNVWWLR